jgi:membrane protease subunit HflC
MKRGIIILIVAFAVLLVIVLSASFYTVAEYEQVVITQFGRPVGKPKTEAGLKFKLPFIQKVHRFEKRLLSWDGQPREIPTRDKRFIWVDTTARWRIKDPLRFLQALGDMNHAYSKLDDIIDGVVRDYVSSNRLVELVRSTDWLEEHEAGKKTLKSPLPGAAPREQLALGREKITQAILTEAAKAMPDFGIELVDFRLKRVNYVPRVRQKVYERMTSERERQAAQYRSEGDGKAAEILGEMEKELKSITSGAYRTAREIRGKADAEATRIYGEAYGQDPEFYAFFKTLEAYKDGSFDNAVLILGTDSPFYKYLKQTGE